MVACASLTLGWPVRKAQRDEPWRLRKACEVQALLFPFILQRGIIIGIVNCKTNKPRRHVGVMAFGFLIISRRGNTIDPLFKDKPDSTDPKISADKTKVGTLKSDAFSGIRFSTKNFKFDREEANVRTAFKHFNK
jgi:hypothetical protein